jgi:hypothetical protein
MNRARDEIFDPDSLHDLLQARNDDFPVPTLSHQTFDALCDRLFTEDVHDWAGPDLNTRQSSLAGGQLVAGYAATLAKPTAARKTERQNPFVSRQMKVSTETILPTRTRGRFWPAVWLALFSLVAGVCFWGIGFTAPNSTSGRPRATATTPPSKYITKAIQDIREGDIVLARDEFGNDRGLKRVVEVYERTSDHLRILTFRTADGTEQTLKTTDEHPVWIEGRNTFIEAKDLAVGDKVSGPNGETQWLASTTYELHPEGIPVYNFQVEDYHTYFVNENDTRAPPVLVHNADDYVPDAPNLKCGIRDRGPDLGQEQGRDFRIDQLELYEFDPDQPKHVRGWLENERRRIAAGNGEPYPRNPPGYVQGHDEPHQRAKASITAMHDFNSTN